MLKKLKVLIADDHAIPRAGLKRLLGDVPRIETIGEAEDGTQARQLLGSEHWDVLLLDLDMPGQNALDLLKAVKAEHTETAVLILTMYPENQFGLRTLKAGASGYLNKYSAPEQLITAILRVSEGGAYISASLASALAKDLHAKPVDPINGLLPDREFAVLRGIAAGRSITEIARELKLKCQDSQHLSFPGARSLGLHTNIELARYALEQGLGK